MLNNETNSTSAPPRVNLNELPSKTFKLKDFELKIFQAENSIILHVTQNKDYSNTLYNAELSLDELKKLNQRIFGSFEKIGDVFAEFFETLGENNIIIKKKENKININIIYEFLGKQEAKIILNPKKASLDETVLKLCDKVKEIDSLNLIIDEQKKTIDKIKKEFDDYKNYAENKFKELEALIKKDSDNLKYNIEYNDGYYLNSDEINKYKVEFPKFKENVNSYIMKYYELNLIEAGIKKKQNKTIKKFTLLFRASRDGYSSSNFHSKCDGKENTLILVETTNRRRFGGYTECQWDQNGNYKNGPYSFIFSFDNKKIYYSKNGSNSIYGYSGQGPTFGSNHDFYINDSCDSSSSGESMGGCYENDGKKYPLTGSSSFLVSDYEVYQLELE